MMPGTVKSIERMTSMGASASCPPGKSEACWRWKLGLAAGGCNSPRRSLLGSVAAALRQFNSVGRELRGGGKGPVGAPASELRKMSPEYRSPGLTCPAAGYF